jgi:threonine synthase
MKYYSTRDKSQSHPTSFRVAALRGLAPDGGLYLPESIPNLDKNTLSRLRDLPFAELALHIALPFLENEVEKGALLTIIKEQLPFSPKLVQIEEHLFSLELFHGPTLAFKDFGASFMAGLFHHFNGRSASTSPTIILAATSGDTGSAVGQAFKEIPGFKVVLLYPAGKVSPIQEAQLTTIGGNVTALKINGTFDDCQRLVKQAFADEELRKKVNLSSANSINIARLIPQMFYYAWMWAHCPSAALPLICAVPSGNFGNLTAGLMAQKMGVAISHFVAATNANDPVPLYLERGNFLSKPSVQTMSNAMDVGNPSNFERMTSLYSESHYEISRSISGYSISESETISAMQRLQEKGYLADPHAAVGFAGLEKYQLKSKENSRGIFLATAHAAKFPESVAVALGISPDVPEALQRCLKATPQYIEQSTDYLELRSFLTTMK